MSKMSVYDESMEVVVIRNGKQIEVMFSEVKDKDEQVDFPGKVVDGDSHFCGDESYDGWMFYDNHGNDYYPEDFDAEQVYDPNQDEEEED